MDLKTGKQVRFGRTDFDFSWERNEARRLEKQLSMYKASAPLIKSEFSEKSRANGFSKFGKSKVFPEGCSYIPKKKWTLDPSSKIVLTWHRIFMVFNLVSLYVDPLFFYIPSELSDPNTNSSCMTRDSKLAIIVTGFRSVADIFYILHVFVKFRIAYVAPSSRVFGKGELVMDHKLIARRYLMSDFFIDVFAALPLPQIMIWSILPAMRNSHSDHSNNALLMIVLVQYIPRLYLIFPLTSQIIKATGVVTKTAWAGAAYNLLLYMLASHIFGAAWYVLSVERDSTCWKSACKVEAASLGCSLTFLDCGTLSQSDRITWVNNTAVFNNCNPSNTTFFQYGMFGTAVSDNLLSTHFYEKYFYCLWWGLQGLSSDGQTLITSTYIGETTFAIIMVMTALVLFALLIGNMQTYLQSLTVRLEEWRLRRRDTEEWMRHRQLPEDLQERVRRFVHYKWLTTRGVDEESILQDLPTDIRRDIQRHLCLDLVKRVPFFSQMDCLLLDAICARLVSSLSTQGTYIVREGDPVTEMLFIIRGKLESSTTNGGRTGFYNSITLRPGDFCGEELLTWALHPKSGLNLPSSTRTLRAVIEVEAFALRAEDLKFVANQFRRLHSKKLQHTFRYYSYHWRTWAACFIQAAWRRHKKRELATSLCMKEEESYHPAQDEPFIDVSLHEDEPNSPARSNSFRANHNQGLDMLVKRFITNTKKGAQMMEEEDNVLPYLPKPDDPDFSAELPNEDWLRGVGHHLYKPVEGPSSVVPTC